MKQRISFPKSLGQAFWFLKPLMKWNFSFAKKGHAFWFSKCLTSFFFPLIPFGHITRKEKRKEKNLLMVLYAGQCPRSEVFPN